MRSHVPWATVLLLLVPFVEVRAGPDRKDAAREEFAAKKREALIEAGKRHVEVGIWCRDAGLIAQASAEFVRATEVSEGQLPWADRILALMRRLGDDFWKKVMKRPGPAYLRTYAGKARKAREGWQKDRLRLAAWAAKKDLEEEALAEYVGILRQVDEPLVQDKEGRIVVEGGTIPPLQSQRIVESAVEINGRLYVRDAFLEKVPEIRSIHEATSERLRVRTERGAQEAEHVLALLTALLPVLEEDLGGSPTQRLHLFVFGTRARYEAWLEAADLGSHKAAAGVADNGRGVTVVCGEGLEGDSLDAVCMHELAHLFFFGVTRAVMPSWYNEGFAETYGGDGTFRYDGKTLAAKGMLADGEFAPLRTDAGYVPLEKLLSGDALTLINEDLGRASSFYAESWALMRYLRQEAPEDVRALLAQWEVLCFGKALGAQAGKPMNRDSTDAAALFRSVFGPRLPEVETGFRRWLAGP